MSTIHLEISVTADNIEKGRKRSCGLCPVALAIRDQLPNADLFRVVVYKVSSNLYTQGQWWRAVHPYSTRLFIQDFDAGIPVEPFTAELQFFPQIAQGNPV